MRLVLRMAVVVIVFGWTVNGMAGIPESQRVLVTDPAELEAMGYSPDASNVFVRVAPGGARVQAEEPTSYGLGIDYATASGLDFIGGKPGFIRAIHDNSQLYCETPGDYSWAFARVFLPDGAEIQGLEVWGYDAEMTKTMLFTMYESCLPDASAGPPVNTTVYGSGSVASGAPGDFANSWSFTHPTTADTKSCFYFIKVRLSSNNLCHGDTLRLQKVRFPFVRQVSPAPVTATFNDVGTGHWAFQYVEALAASGITAGCGSSSFCPDKTLTRAEMAIFLSKALGLYWSLDNH